MNEIKKVTHIVAILKELLDGEVSTSIDSKASNRNQYYPTIKKHGIELYTTPICQDNFFKNLIL